MGRAKQKQTWKQHVPAARVVTFRLTSLEATRLDARARGQGVSTSAYLRRLLRLHFEPALTARLEAV